MLRACHRDTCKPGVATQRPHLRANFTGTPEGVAAVLPVRRRGGAGATWPSWGCARSTRPSGRVDLLRQRTHRQPAGRRHGPRPAPGARRRPTARGASSSGSSCRTRGPTSATSCWPTPSGPSGTATTSTWPTRSATPTAPSAPRCRAPSPSSTASCRRGARRRVRFTGTAGQSFGAFLAHGVELDLTGEANDYVGKGMGGGRGRDPPPDERRRPSCPVLAGNTCLYGATGGELFVAGGVGERFGVRNSGATAVVEGAGDHCCEYMTGGTIVVLGRGRLQPRRRHDRRPGLRVRPRPRAAHLAAQPRPGRRRAARHVEPRGGALARRAPRRAHRLAAVGACCSSTGPRPPPTCGTSCRRTRSAGTRKGRPSRVATV